MELPRSLICAAGEAFRPLSCAVDGEAAAPPDRILRRRPEGCGDCPAGVPGPSPYSMMALWPPLENVIVGFGGEIKEGKKRQCVGGVLLFTN